MAVDLSGFQGSFFEESDDHISTMEEGLLQLEQRPGDLDLLNRIFRAAHSIKGNAGMFGFIAVSEFTHKMENVLDALRNSNMEVSQPLTDLLLASTDALKGLLGAAQGNHAPDEALVAPLREQLLACLEGQALSSPPSTPPETAASGEGQETAAAGESQARLMEITWVPALTLFQRGMDPSRIIRELHTLGELTTRLEGVDRLPPIDGMDPEQCYLSWAFSLMTDRPRADIESVFEFVREGATLDIHERAGSTLGDASRVMRDTSDQKHPDPDSTESSPQPLGEILVQEGVISQHALRHALSQQKRLGEILVEQHAASPEQISKALSRQNQQAAGTQSKKMESASIRVDTEKIDKVINLVGELVITQSMLTDLSMNFSMERWPALQQRIGELAQNTREIQERVMAVRMLPVGTSFQRFPRLVRDLTAKNNKKIQLVLSGEETELDKTVMESIGDPLTHLVRNSADHGLELPAERVAAGKPAQGTIRLNAFHEGGSICITVEDDGRGLNRDKILAKARAQGLIAEGEQVADDQVWPLIFKPGFSTAEKVTDVSGRGVGLDVVKRNIEALGGTTSIRTRPGQGTTFVLKLPLTLAIIEGMTVRVGAETYILPLITILESIQPKKEQLKTVVGRGELINVRGSYISVVRLHKIFAVPADNTELTKGILVVLEIEGERAAVMVDELIGQQQVVIKSLEKHFQKVEGIAGATILGDGTVGFILDVRGLFTLARGNATATA